MKRRDWRFSLVALAVFSGCGEDWHADTYPASGHVRVNGAPAAGALVQLQPVGEAADERESRPWGLVKEDGSFSLGTYEADDGAPAGDYRVTLTWPPDASRPSTEDRLGHRYARPDQSPWKVTIREEENTIPPISITEESVNRPATAGPSGPFMPGLSSTGGPDVHAR